MNVGQLRELMKSLPSNAPVILESADHELRAIDARITVVCKVDHEVRHFGKVTGSHDGEVTVLLIQ